MLLLDILGDEPESKSGKLSTERSDSVNTEKRAKQRSRSQNHDGRSEANVISEDSIRKSERRRHREEKKKRHEEKYNEILITEAPKSEPVLDIWGSIFGFIINPTSEPAIEVEVSPSPRRSKRDGSERNERRKEKEKSRSHRSKRDQFESEKGDFHAEKSRFPDSYTQLDNEPHTTSEESKPDQPDNPNKSEFTKINRQSSYNSKSSNSRPENTETSPTAENVANSLEPAVADQSTLTTNSLEETPLSSTTHPTSFIAKSRRRASALFLRLDTQDKREKQEPLSVDPILERNENVSQDEPQRAATNSSSSRRLSASATNFPWFLPFGRQPSDSTTPLPPNETSIRQPDLNTSSAKSSVDATTTRSDVSHHKETMPRPRVNLDDLRTQFQESVRIQSNSPSISSESTHLNSRNRHSKPDFTSQYQPPALRPTPSQTAAALSIRLDSSSVEVASLLGDGLPCGFCQSVQVSLPRKMPSASASSSAAPQGSVRTSEGAVPIQTLLCKPCCIKIVSRPRKDSVMQPVLVIELLLRSSSKKLCTLMYAIPEDICDVRAGLDESASLTSNPGLIGRGEDKLSSILGSSSSSWSNLEQQAGQFGLTIRCREPNPNVALVFSSLSVRDDVLRAVTDILRMFSPYGS